MTKKEIALKEVKNMCDANYEYYTAKFDDLYAKYAEKFIVLKNSIVIGVYDSFEQAYDETVKTEEIGTFLIQHCTKEENNVNYFYSNNVVFV